MTLTAKARVNMGYWVADCPRPYCTSAEHYGGRMNGLGMAELGGLTETGFTCKTCGLQCPSEWPKDRLEIERLLMARPNPRNRNWELNETLLELLSENVAHGIYSPRSLEVMNTPIEARPSEGPIRVDELTMADVTSILQEPLRALEGGA